MTPRARKPVDVEPRSVTVPFPTVTGNHARAPRKGGHGWYVTPRARDYRHDVEFICASQRLTPLLGLVEVRVGLFRGEDAGGKLRRADADGAVKVLLDALQGRAFTNDGRIRDLHVRIRDDRQNPRAEVLALPHDPERPPCATCGR